MNRLTVTLGLCLLCALSMSAIAAQSAVAASKGTTAFTCVKGKGTLRGEHCLTTGSAAAEFGHVAIPENMPTEFVTTNERTSGETEAAESAILKVTIAGTPLEMRATAVSGSGTMENRKAETGEHYVSWTTSTAYTGVTVNKPEGKGCKVYEDKGGGAEGAEGVIRTNELKGTTLGQGDRGKLEPAFENIFATFLLTCNKGEVPEALEGTWTITGSLSCPTNGATIVCSHFDVTEQNTLKGKGSKAGVNLSTTIKGRNPLKDPAGQFTPLSPTTVETP